MWLFNVGVVSLSCLFMFVSSSTYISSCVLLILCLFFVPLFVLLRVFVCSYSSSFCVRLVIFLHSAYLCLFSLFIFILHLVLPLSSSCSYYSSSSLYSSAASRFPATNSTKTDDLNIGRVCSDSNSSFWPFDFWQFYGPISMTFCRSEATFGGFGSAKVRPSRPVQLSKSKGRDFELESLYTTQ